jgi:methylmalonyl-CoA epimerase
MLNKVHHVTFVVESIDDMAAYIERNFSIAPMSRDEFEDRGFKSILYRIGETYVDFFEPLRDDTPLAQQLKATGPGVMHVAFGVDGIDQVFSDLVAKGNQMRSDAPAPSPFGYRNLNIDTNSSHGILFQLAEGEVSH